MHFMLAGGLWRVSFLAADLTTPLRRRFAFTLGDKVIEMAQRGGASFALDDRQALEHGLQAGRGAVWLNLTEEQYATLR